MPLHTIEVHSEDDGIPYVHKSTDELRNMINLSKIKQLMWLCFDDKMEQEKYLKFLETRTSLVALMASASIATLAVAVVVVRGIVYRVPATVVVVRLLQLLTMTLAIMYAVIDIKKCHQVLPRHNVDFQNNFTSRFNLTTLANCIIVSASMAGGLVLLQRSIRGQCAENEDISACNPYDSVRALPSGTLITNLIQVLFVPLLFKSHNVPYVIVSYLITMFSILASSVIVRAYQELTTIITISLVLAFAMYEHESSMFSLYASQLNSRKFHEEALHAVQSKQASDLEKDSLCSLIGNVAHDLKTPLQSFMSEIGNLESLFISLQALTADNSIIVQELHKEIKNNLNSLESTYSFMMLAINRGIDFRKAMAGLSLQPQSETFMISKAMDWAVSRFDSSPAGVQLNVLPPINLNSLCPMMMSDKHWFSENILSLVSNALKFTMKGAVDVIFFLAALSDKGKQYNSSVVIYDLTTEDLFLPMHSNPDDDKCDSQLYVLVIVQDEGVGIPVEMRSTLFQPFKQAQRRAGGTGLGLFSISKRMEALGGHCGVQGRSDGKQGSCFWLAYPYVPDWESAREETARAAYGSNSFQQNGFTGNKDVRLETSRSDRLADNLLSALSSMPQSRLKYFAMPLEDPFWRQVLLIEDSSLIVKAVTRLLKREGFQVDVAQNGVVGLEKMKVKRYVFVLSDIQMPMMDGNEMVKRLRDFENLNMSCGERLDKSSVRRQLIIGMSANSDIVTEKEALSSGMDYFIPKPVSISSLKTCLFTEYAIGNDCSI